MNNVIRQKRNVKFVFTARNLVLWKEVSGYLDVIKKLHYDDSVIRPDPSLEPDRDDDNIEHIPRHGLRPEQIEEVYYSEGPYPTFALKNKKKLFHQIPRPSRVLSFFQLLFFSVRIK